MEDRRAVASAALREFETGFLGTVLTPGDDGYDEARAVWNGMIDRRPSAVARCVDATDVQRAVAFARSNDLRIAVRGGGHNVAGDGVCDDGVVIDCSTMNGVRVDADERTGRVEGGATIGEFDSATQVHGLAAPGGVISSTGIGGLTLGGGWGWLSRSYGLAVDSLRAADVVTADGNLVRASAATNPDLFWAIRGGGGNFGVVTAFEFDLHAVGPTVLAGMLVYPFESAEDLLRFHREFTRDAPNELCCYASVRTAPPVSFLPADLHGEPVAAVYLCYNGDPEDGERVIRPLRAFRDPVFDGVEPRRYAEFQQFFDDVYPPGFRNYWKSQFVDDAGLPDGAIDTIIEYASSFTSPLSSVVVEHLGGAISQVDSDATAYAHRDAGYACNIFTRWEDPAEDDRHVAWTREFFAAVVPHLGDGVYVNFLSREGEERVRAAFGENYNRLVAVKSRFDPENVFRVNQNVPPV